MSDIYDYIDSPNSKTTDNITDKNSYPKPQPEDKDRPSNPEGSVVPETVDFYQQHLYKDQINEPSGLFSFYDPYNPDRQYMDMVEMEVIQLTSPPIEYYKFVKEVNNVDDIYGEAVRRDGYENPVTIFGNYEDPTFDQELMMHGLIQIEEIEIWFNYNHLLNTIKDRLQMGDVLQTYDGKLWEVMTSILVNENLWRAQNNLVKCKRLQTEGIFLPDKGNISESPNVKYFK